MYDLQEKRRILIRRFKAEIHSLQDGSKLAQSEQGTVDLWVVGSIPPKPENSNLCGFELQGPLTKSTKLLSVVVIKAIITICILEFIQERNEFSEADSHLEKDSVFGDVHNKGTCSDKWIRSRNRLYILCCTGKKRRIVARRFTLQKDSLFCLVSLTVYVGRGVTWTFWAAKTLFLIRKGLSHRDS